MTIEPFKVVRDFEAALCEYTGAPYAVTTSSCTMALLLAVAWHLRGRGLPSWAPEMRQKISIPKRTYVSVPMSIIHAGGWPIFRDEDWSGWYNLWKTPIWDSARWFTSGLYKGAQKHIHDLGEVRVDMSGQMVCTSFHWSKTLGIQQGGAILHDNPEADAWLRRARFDGRTEGIAPKDDTFDVLGWHCIMSPEVAAEGLVRLSLIPRHNEPLPNSDYPDLSLCQLFRI